VHFGILIFFAVVLEDFQDRKDDQEAKT